MVESVTRLSKILVTIKTRGVLKFLPNLKLLVFFFSSVEVKLNQLCLFQNKNYVFCRLLEASCCCLSDGFFLKFLSLMTFS